MSKLLDQLFNKDLFLKKVDKFDLTTLQNIYCLSREKAFSEIEQFKSEGYPECYAIVCDNCYHLCQLGSISKFNHNLNKQFECEYCFHRDVLTTFHPGLYTFFFNENAKGLTHNPEDSLEDKLAKSFLK